MRSHMCDSCFIGFTESEAADEYYICPKCGGRIERTEHIGIPKEPGAPTTNCTCGNPLREGERECDKCLLHRYDLKGKVLGAIERDDVAQALRRAEKESTNDD